MSELFATRLNNHTIFKNLVDKIGKDKAKCMRLITCKNDILYIWNGVDGCVDTVNIKQILKEADFTEYISLVPTPSLFFTVENVSVNCTSTILALYGPSGISVMKLPDRWLLKEKRVDVQCHSLAQRLFLCDHHVVRQVKWHPGSPSDSHLLMLTSDEKLRLYNALDDSMLWECSLSNHVMRKNIPNMVSIGETPVDFDFGIAEGSENSDNIKWPVYIVWGNGDVFSILTTMEEEVRKIPLQGPFRIVPSAEDNYGSDASSIIVMDTSPPLIVVSTCGGQLCHCLLLSDDSASRYDEADTKVLHVIERIELELGIPIGSEAEDDIVTCPIHLEIDPTENSRYFCIHNAGMHSVTVPFVQKLLDLSNGESLAFDPYKIPSYTEYLLCTGITSGSDISFSPILGIAYLDLTKLLVLLSNGKLINIPLLHQCDYSFTPFGTESSLSDTAKEPFQIYINNLLKDNGVSSCPLIKLPGDNTRPQDWLEIVGKATHSFRAILKCHSEVALKIQQKTESLKIILAKQMVDMEKLNEEKSSLRSTAEQVAEKYEEINEKQSELIKRAEKLLLKIECDRDKTLTTNEKKMSNLLEKAKSKVFQLEQDFGAVQSFFNQLEVNSKQTEEKNIHLGNKSQMLYKNLKHLNNEVSDLTRRVKVAQENVSLCQFQDT